ncbi:5'/3'-nucleotidase SurE [Gordonia hydrophobica]|uniref:5'-nucleotidase n=1 Tax=Gordonia hydrophobica TaxID=40516 RepID=A0ABZ2U6H1_9ACTN|nr:5'/3'-nucleotidase SurE [Gordonia hydrophobica]MBM7365393.1 5'-nucleotidase [Gordonia hydrophobica]
MSAAPRRRILVTNDDGVDSPGLIALAVTAANAGHDVLVAAPHRQSSGASSGLGFSPEVHPVVDRRRVDGLRTEVIAVAAQPGLIALLAMTGQLGPVPDVVLSGINDASNLGAAVLHSGTAGAALVGAAHGAVGVAVSLYLDDQPDSAERSWHTAVSVVADVLDHLVASSPGTAYNINVPNVPHLEKPLVHAEWRLDGCVPTLVPFIAAVTDAAGIDMISPEISRGSGTDIALVGAGHPTVSRLSLVGDRRVEWAQQPPDQP